MCFIHFPRFFLSAHWWGFSDPHSQLSHYEWRAGTSAGAEDILPPKSLDLEESALTKLDQAMPENVLIYITIRAYNRAGLSTEASSNGVKVDSSHPVNDTIPTIDISIGMLVPNTQVRIAISAKY